MENKKWYDNKVLANLLLVFFFPVGLYAVWKSNTIAKWWKVTATILIALIVVANMGNDGTVAEQETIAASAKPEYTQAQLDSIAVVERVAAIEERKSATISAADLFAHYEANEVKADQNFKDKTFFVEGVVDDIGKDILGDPYVTLRSTNIFSVQCMVEDENVVAELSKGMRVTVQGTCDGKMGNVLMRNCKLVPNLADM
jgi:acyl carrier protein